MRVVQMVWDGKIQAFVLPEQYNNHHWRLVQISTTTEKLVVYALIASGGIVS